MIGQNAQTERTRAGISPARKGSDMTQEQRYAKAMKKIGGPAALLNLPEEVKKILRETTDPEIKTQMLELIAERMSQ